MTLFCEHCERRDALTLVDGQIDVADGDLQFVALVYRCGRCALSGTYRNAGDTETVHGALVRVESRGTPLDDHRGIDR